MLGRLSLRECFRVIGEAGRCRVGEDKVRSEAEGEGWREEFSYTDESADLQRVYNY